MGNNYKQTKEGPDKKENNKQTKEGPDDGDK